MKKYHAGKILLDPKFLLRLTQFDGGTIHYAGQDPDRLGTVLILEHHDLPEVGEGEQLPIVNPEYINHFDDNYIRIAPKLGILTKVRLSIRWMLKIWKS